MSRMRTSNVPKLGCRSRRPVGAVGRNRAGSTSKRRRTRSVHSSSREPNGATATPVATASASPVTGSKRPTADRRRSARAVRRRSPLSGTGRRTSSRPSACRRCYCSSRSSPDRMALASWSRRGGTATPSGRRRRGRYQPWRTRSLPGPVGRGGCVDGVHHGREPLPLSTCPEAGILPAIGRVPATTGSTSSTWILWWMPLWG